MIFCSRRKDSMHCYMISRQFSPGICLAWLYHSCYQMVRWRFFHLWFLDSSRWNKKKKTLAITQLSQYMKSYTPEETHTSVCAILIPTQYVFFFSLLIARLLTVACCGVTWNRFTLSACQKIRTPVNLASMLSQWCLTIVRYGPAISKSHSLAFYVALLQSSQLMEKVNCLLWFAFLLLSCSVADSILISDRLQSTPKSSLQRNLATLQVNLGPKSLATGFPSLQNICEFMIRTK